MPFKGVATLIPMVDGIVKCAHNAIRGLTIRARVVYQGDEFEYRDGAHVVLNHTMGAFCDPPRIVDKRAENIIAAYAVAHQPGSMEPDILVFDRATLDIYRGYSRSRSGPWDTHYAQMCGKTVVKQLLKRMPKATAMLPEPPPELEMAGYELVAPDGLEGVINNPALMPAATEPWKRARVDASQRQRCHGRDHRRTRTRTNRKCRRRPMTTTTRRFRRCNDDAQIRPIDNYGGAWKKIGAGREHVDHWVASPREL